MTGQRFTERAQRVILIAQEEARRLRQKAVEPGHLLLGILALGEGGGFDVLRRNKADMEELGRNLAISAKKAEVHNLLGEIPFTEEAKRVLAHAVEEAQSFSVGHVGTEHLILALWRVEASARAMTDVGLTLESTRRLVSEMTKAQDRMEPWETPAPHIQRFFQSPVISIVLHPQVTGMLMTHRPVPDETYRNVLLILLKEGADFVLVHNELSKTLLGIEKMHVEYKVPGKRPQMWYAGKWQEDLSFPETLIY